MKFTLEELCKALTEKMTAKGEKLNLSERSIKEQSETLIALLANDETELADFVEKILPLFKTADNNVRNDVSVAVKDYIQKNPTQNQGNKVVDEKKKDTSNDDLSNALSRLEELEKKLAESEQKSLIDNRKSLIVSKLGEKGVKDKEWINSLLEEVNLLSEDFNVDDKVKKFTTMYNKSKANVNPNITPNEPDAGGDDSKRISASIKAAKAYANSQNLQTNS